MKYENGCFDGTIAELRALTTYASDDQTRMHLASVCFDLEGKRASATDGHRLIVIDASTLGTLDDGEARGKSLVNARALQAALRGLGGRTKRVKVRCDEKAVTIECDHVRAMLETVDATFPPIDQVIPSIASIGKPAEVIGFNPRYVRDLGAVADIQESHKQLPQLKLRLGGELDPARVDADLLDEGSVTIVVMPMRV